MSLAPAATTESTIAVDPETFRQARTVGARLRLAAADLADRLVLRERDRGRYTGRWLVARVRSSRSVPPEGTALVCLDGPPLVMHHTPDVKEDR